MGLFDFDKDKKSARPQRPMNTAIPMDDHDSVAPAAPKPPMPPKQEDDDFLNISGFGHDDSGFNHVDDSASGDNADLFPEFPIGQSEPSAPVPPVPPVPPAPPMPRGTGREPVQGPEDGFDLDIPAGTDAQDVVPAANSFLFSAGNTMKGALNSSTDIIIEGVFSGPIQTEANIFIRGDGRVNGDISANLVKVTEGGTLKGNATADTVIVDGRMHGDVNAHSTQFRACARYKGNVVTDTLSTNPGAVIHGNITINGADDDIDDFDDLDAPAETIPAAPTPAPAPAPAEPAHESKKVVAEKKPAAPDTGAKPATPEKKPDAAVSGKDKDNDNSGHGNHSNDGKKPAFVGNKPTVGGPITD